MLKRLFFWGSKAPSLNAPSVAFLEAAVLPVGCAWQIEFTLCWLRSLEAGEIVEIAEMKQGSRWVRYWMHQIDLRICVADFHLDSVSRVQDGCDWLMQKSRQEMCRWLRRLWICLPAKFSPASKQLFHSLSKPAGLYKEMIFPHKIQTPRNGSLGVEFVGEFYQKDFGISLMGTLWNSVFEWNLPRCR